MAQWKGRTFPIGWHIGPGGNASGLVRDYLAPLDEAGIRWFLKSVDAYPLNAVNIAKASDIPHDIVWRSTFTDVPDYDRSPVEAARLHWSDTLQRIPPEFDKDIVWLEGINEIDKNRANWLGYFGVEWANLARDAKYKTLMFGWSSGEPEPEHWLLPGMVEFLTLASQNRDWLGVSLHEYSYSTEDVYRWYPYLIGRYRQLFNACKTLGIPEVTVAITEWGWEYEDVPNVGDAIVDIDMIAQEYVKHPTIMGAGLWYLGPGFGDIANQAQPLIKPTGELALTWQHYVEHPWPPEGGEPPPDPPPAGDNILANWSMEDGNYKWQGIDELNIPNEWSFWYADESVPNPIDDNPWSEFRRPEAVNPSKAFIPEEEHEILFLHGEYVEKIFKGSGAIYFKLFQTVSLKPGQHLLTMPVFADLVKGYTQSGDKIWADDPEGRDGLAKIHFGSYESDWMSLQPGRYNVLTNLAVVSDAGEYEVGVEIMLPFALAQNGVFLDAFSLEVEAEPPPSTGCIDTSQFKKYHILRPAVMNDAQWAWIRSAMEGGIEVPGIGHVSVGYEGWSHIDAIGAIKESVMAGFGESRLIVVDGHLIGTGLDEAWMEANCPFMVPYTVYLTTDGTDPPDPPDPPDPDDPVIHDIVNDLPTHPTKEYGTRPRSDITTLVVHHTTGDPFQPIENIASYHVNGKGWPGIGYHFVIDGAGKIHMTNYPETWSYHSNYANPYAMAVCMQGNFTHVWPSPAQLAACKSLIDYLGREIPTITGLIPHRQAPGASTQCPGNTWTEWWSLLAGEPSEPEPAGSARLGLHASADGGLASGELEAFATARVELVKILSSMDGEDVTALANEFPDAPFVIRAFLHFGGRVVSPQQFFDWTASDVRRAIDRLKDHYVIVELHNEPNLYAEGLGANWRNGTEYAIWANEVLQLYKSAFAGYEFAFPGLSPGGDVGGVRYDSARFLAEASGAIENHEYLGAHAYWAANFPMSLAFQQIEQVVSMYPGKPIIVTEASNNKGTTSQEEKGREYITFAEGLKERATVYGVTYFIASASDEGWGWSTGTGETWVNTSIPGIVGQRS
jgi:hypothetical protein